MFTKKHYEAIAKVLQGYKQYNGEREYPGGGEVDAMIDGMVSEFGDMLERDNPNFDRGRFLKACGYGS